MAYNPIADYGVIGNLRTTALVGKHGSIDWYCFPNFDSPSLFGCILDENIGGHFQLRPIGEGFRERQFYVPDTNVLVTDFLSDDNAGEVVDFMPIKVRGSDHRNQWLIRQVQAMSGQVRFRMHCKPAFDYARVKHETLKQGNTVVFRSPALSMELYSDIEMHIDEDSAVADFTLAPGEKAMFIFRPAFEAEEPQPSMQAIDDCRRETVSYWRRWLARCAYRGRWWEMVSRSALLLKLLTFEPTGAVVAAPTCSIPEDIGGERNWDYRYTWMRDASFTLYALMRIGFFDESAAFMHWLYERCTDPNPDGSLQIVYGIDGRRNLEEMELDHLEGYQASRPVRIGNGAYNQSQLDIYGEIMDSIYLYNKYGAPISYDLWTHIANLVNYVADHWREPDCGVWEVRGELQHFTYSKVMCWVAVDRALRLADKRSFPAPHEKWLQVRDDIYRDIMQHGWNPGLQTFTQSYSNKNRDASNLIMPLVFFMSPADPRMIHTLDAINRPVEKGGLLTSGLVLRYLNEETDDGLSGRQGAFSLCSFWLVEALTRAGRFDSSKLDQARLLFERLLSHANHLGLYSEEIGRDGKLQGNFPQAFTHIALISAAYNLNEALEHRR